MEGSSSNSSTSRGRGRHISKLTMVMPSKSSILSMHLDADSITMNAYRPLCFDAIKAGRFRVSPRPPEDKV